MEGVIATNLAAVRSKIETAARAAGRGPEQVTLVAVSKTHPAAAVRQALAAGHRAFAVREPTAVTAASDWLSSVAAGAKEEASTTLRLVPPDVDDMDTDDQPFSAVVQLQSRRDPSLVVDAANLWAAPDAVLARFGDDAETTLLLALRRGGRVWPPLNRLLAQARPNSMNIGQDERLAPAAADKRVENNRLKKRQAQGIGREGTQRDEGE